MAQVWGTGQDQVRVIKQRLLEMVRDLRVFLDVDVPDLKIGDGGLEQYVERSGHVLIFMSHGYAASKNCLRELRATVQLGKPLIPVLEVDPQHGGLSMETMCEQLVAADAKYVQWGFDGASPKGGDLARCLAERHPIEWSRLSAFQDVALREVAGRLLPDGHGAVYLDGELALPRASAPLPPPPGGKRYHVYCSPHNAGATELIRELAGVQWTAEEAELSEAVQMLVYLDGRTWVGDGAFAAEVERAMGCGVRLLLAHEMPGIGQAARHGVEFSSFFQSTPQRLIEGGIYDDLAVPLKGAVFRPTSLAMLAAKLAPPSPAPQPRPVPTVAGCRRVVMIGAAGLWRWATRQRASGFAEDDDHAIMLKMSSGRTSGGAKSRSARGMELAACASSKA